jgi:hypothetical protein
MKVYEDDKNVMYKKLEKYTYGVDGVKENKDFNSPNAVKICGTNIPYENLLVVEK